VFWSACSRTNENLDLTWQNAVSKLRASQYRNLASTFPLYFFIYFGTNKYDDILARLNLSMLQSRRRHLNALFGLNAFNNTITCFYKLSTVSIQVPAKITREHSIFDALHCAKANPSARHVTAANAVCKLNVFDDNDSSHTKFRIFCIKLLTL
jgi:hypothetical protein